MSGLSEQERESLETANYDAEGRGLGDGHPIFTTVEAIVARRVAAALEPVKALHQPFECCNVRCEGGGLHCSTCDEGGNGDVVFWPCPTYSAALAAATETGGEA